MPDMNGVEILETKNEHPKLKEVPTIVISTSEHVDLALKCIEAGAEDFFVKPPNKTILRARVKTSLEKKTPPRNGPRTNPSESYTGTCQK